MNTVTLFGKRDCHLCDEARAVLQQMRLRYPFQLVEKDITEDDDLHRRYLERIPVIALDGEELFDHFVDEVALAERLTG